MIVGSRLQWSLRHTRLRLFESLLIMLAVGLGVAVLVTVVSLFARIGTETAKVLENRRFRTFEVSNQSAQVSLRSEPPIKVVTHEDRENLEITYADLKALQSNLPQGMHVFIDNYRFHVRTPLLASEESTSDTGGLSRFGLASDSFLVLETTPGYYHFYQPKLVAGTWFTQEDVEQRNRVIVLGSRLAEKLYPAGDAVGKKLPVEHWAGTIEYEVVGVVEPSEDELAFGGAWNADGGFVPINASPYGSGQTFPSLYIGVEPGIDLAFAHEAITGEVTLLLGDGVSVRSPLAEFQQVRLEQSKTALVVGALASVGLIVAVINILNLILARVLRRTKSIGLALAVGSSRAMIFQQFLVESLVLGLLGAGLGIGLSFGFDWVISRALGGFAAGGFWIRLLVGGVLGILVSLLFGVYPAYQGARVDPAEALRTD